MTCGVKKLEHASSLDPCKHFTVKDTKPDGSMPFLEILVMPESERSPATTVYGKPTHTNQYLQWNNHLNIAAKYSVINTLTHRAKTVCSNPQLLPQEHLTEAL